LNPNENEIPLLPEYYKEHAKIIEEGWGKATGEVKQRASTSECEVHVLVGNDEKQCLL